LPYRAHGAHVFRRSGLRRSAHNVGDSRVGSRYKFRFEAREVLLARRFNTYVFGWIGDDQSRRSPCSWIDVAIAKPKERVDPQLLEMTLIRSARFVVDDLSRSRGQRDKVCSSQPPQRLRM